ncbi:hypothetical protein SLA_4243 [Streptomyces laurentii]|uniref:Uncharacterized protein n=1 Tax=Streptomyces laurentii TaxID=39478 RepID=A0A160P3B0_STRLU|nr:hypothetical protein SLA_4243 [Streptomyces laurentii]
MSSDSTSSRIARSAERDEDRWARSRASGSESGSDSVGDTDTDTGAASGREYGYRLCGHVEVAAGFRPDGGAPRAVRERDRAGGGEAGECSAGWGVRANELEGEGGGGRGRERERERERLSTGAGAG